MNSFIISSRSQDQISKKLEELLDKEKVDLLDRTTISFEKAIGIENIRIIQEKIALKPFKGERKALIVDLFSGITQEAQNAMLKLLEEPPANTLIFLTIANKDGLLPTIISRCKIIEINVKDEIFSDSQGYIDRILNSGDGEKLEIAQEFGKDRQTAVNFTEQTLSQLDHLIKKANPKDLKSYSKLLANLNRAYPVLKKSNVNPRFILENFLLSSPEVLS